MGWGKRGENRGGLDRNCSALFFFFSSWDEDGVCAMAR